MKRKISIKNTEFMKILLKKVTVEILYISMLSVLYLTSINSVKAQTYDPYDVKVINTLIKNNGFNAKPDDPESWNILYDEYRRFIEWTEEVPKKIRRLDISYNLLSGKVSLVGLTKMTYLNCSDNYITILDLTNCSSLSDICIISNKLIEINLTGVEHKLDLFGYQLASPITLYKNENGTYSLPISLNEPTFYEQIYGAPFSEICTAISYKDGILESSDNKLMCCDYRIKPIGYKYSNYIEGAMNFYYSDEMEVINAHDKEGLKIYPNPTYDTLFIECSFTIGSSLTVKLYDMLGKEVLNQSINSDDGINISHLNNGNYIVNIFLDGKIIGNTKIVKQ